MPKQVDAIKKKLAAKYKGKRKILKEILFA
jgi:hypothetical protein